jgi:uncharacterized protein YqiB (DUF1249 family)
MTKKVHSTIYKRLFRLIPDLAELEPGAARTWKSEGYMPLRFNVLYKGEDTPDYPWVRISLAHTYIQNGDVMADPDMEIKVYLSENWPYAEAMTYQQDGLGIYQVVYPGNDQVNLAAKRDLNNFLADWLNNLRKQGFKAELADAHS